jgi:hypothetical protein
MDDERVYIMDVYNRGIYPHDGFAKRKFIFTRYIFTVKVFYFVGVNVHVWYIVHDPVNWNNFYLKRESKKHS